MQEASLRDQLMKFLQLDMEFTDGYGDWLEGIRNGKKYRILDVCGSFGINLLGHKHPNLMEVAREIDKMPPFFLQGSKKETEIVLKEKIRTLLAAESKHKNWQIHLCNTGTETVEVALKIAWLQHERFRQELITEVNYALHYFQLSSKNPQSNCHQTLIANLQQSGVSHPLAYWEGLREQLQQAPSLMHLENSFHGKTMGALSAMGNPYYRQSFPLPYHALKLEKDIDSIADAFRSACISYVLIHPRTHHPIPKQYCPVFAVLLEPFQGEAGIIPLKHSLIRMIRELCNTHRVALISDEIQAGLFRTGTFAAIHHSAVSADLYCFSKALGGGMAKTGAVCVRSEQYPEQYSRYHSSSFSGDHFSSTIAVRSLELLEVWAKEGDHTISVSLCNMLSVLQDEFPELIKEVRGQGLLWGIEFDMAGINRSFITKYLKDLSVLGYWISSVLLTREEVRIYPTLSAPLTFRIQPSIHFGEKEIQYLFHAFHHLCTALRTSDIAYLFGHLFEIPLSVRPQTLPPALQDGNIPKGAACFICHPIDLEHYKNIIQLTHALPNELLHAHIQQTRSMQEFSIYHKDSLYNIHGERIDLIFLGIPITSQSFYHALRNGRKQEIVAKIQKAVSLASHAGASVIGLGQFTSILTQNGMLLNPGSSQLTTGNAYTAWLTFSAIQEECRNKGWELASKKIAVVGAGGNITAVLTLMLIEEAGHITLIHRKRQKLSRKLRSFLITLFQEICQSSSCSPVIQGVRKIIRQNNYRPEQDVVEILGHPHIQQYLVVSDDMYQTAQADLVIVGTNSVLPLIHAAIVKPDSILVDISVPSNVEEELKHADGISYIKGGMAALPLHHGKLQQLKSVIFPFKAGESFACMAETFGLAFAGKQGSHHIGSLTKAKVLEVKELMEAQGFRLGNIKRTESL